MTTEKTYNISKLTWEHGELAVRFEKIPELWTARMFVKDTKIKVFMDTIENHLTKQIDKFNKENK
jgi:hypothetical protein